MRLFVTQGELNKHFLSFDTIHDHSIYGLDINDSRLVDTTELGVHLALLRENQQDNVSKKQTLKIPKAEKSIA